MKVYILTSDKLGLLGAYMDQKKAEKILLRHMIAHFQFDDTEFVTETSGRIVAKGRIRATFVSGLAENYLDRYVLSPLDIDAPIDEDAVDKKFHEVVRKELCES